QVRRQHAGWSIAAQLITVRADLNIAAAQLRKKGGHAHNSISSRLTATLGRCLELATHVNASMASANAATLGRSKRLRIGRSMPDASRILDMSRIAMSEWPPRSK